jgi:hypothetical protein
LPLPKVAEECEFPKWLAVTTGRTVSPDGSMLVEVERNADA